VNQTQRQLFLDKILAHYPQGVQGKTFGIWGLAFKPNTDDIREAPALYLLDALIGLGAKVRVYDPEAMDNVKKSYPASAQLHYAATQYEALETADALLIVTEWNLFRNPDFEKMSQLLQSKTIFDGRNVYDTVEMKKLGFFYESIGR